MLFVFIILLIVTACVTIVSTYILLNSEDHRWYVLNVGPYLAKYLKSFCYIFKGTGWVSWLVDRLQYTFIYILCIILLTEPSKHLFIYLFILWLFINFFNELYFYHLVHLIRMYGLFQTSFYFGNTAIVCFGLFVMLGK